jgi:hypothetical protein
MHPRQGSQWSRIRVRVRLQAYRKLSRTVAPRPSGATATPRRIPTPLAIAPPGPTNELDQPCGMAEAIPLIRILKLPVQPSPILRFRNHGETWGNPAVARPGTPTYTKRNGLAAKSFFRVTESSGPKCAFPRWKRESGDGLAELPNIRTFWAGLTQTQA